MMIVPTPLQSPQGITDPLPSSPREEISQNDAPRSPVQGDCISLSDGEVEWCRGGRGAAVTPVFDPFYSVGGGNQGRRGRRGGVPFRISSGICPLPVIYLPLDASTVPRPTGAAPGFKDLRACMTCRLVKAYAQFVENGCENCEDFSKSRADELTTANFEGYGCQCIPTCAQFKHSPPCFAAIK